MFHSKITASSSTPPRNRKYWADRCKKYNAQFETYESRLDSFRSQIEKIQVNKIDIMTPSDYAYAGYYFKNSSAVCFCCGLIQQISLVDAALIPLSRHIQGNVLCLYLQDLLKSRVNSRHLPKLPPLM